MGLFDKLFQARSSGKPAQPENKPPCMPAVEITACIIDGWDWGIADHVANLIADKRFYLRIKGRSYQVPPSASISWLITWPKGCARCDDPNSANFALLTPRL